MTLPWVQATLAEGGLFAIPAALLAGSVMGLNPCCLALYPAAAASCCAGTCDAPERPVLSRAAMFVLGTAIAMTILGTVAALAGETLAGLGGWVPFVVAAVPIVMGALLLAGVRIPTPRALRAFHGGMGGAFFTGLLLSLVISPCGTPALAAILSFAAYKGSPRGARGSVRRCSSPTAWAMGSPCSSWVRPRAKRQSVFNAPDGRLG